MSNYQQPHHGAYICTRCGWSHLFAVGKRRYCRPCQQAANKEWMKRNPFHWAEYDKKRRKRPARETVDARARWLRNGKVTVDDLKAIYRRDGGRCVYCKEQVVAQFLPKQPRGFDHVVSRTRGGKHEADNIVTSCADCNRRKGVKTTYSVAAD